MRRFTRTSIAASAAAVAVGVMASLPAVAAASSNFGRPSASAAPIPGSDSCIAPLQAVQTFKDGEPFFTEVAGTGPNNVWALGENFYGTPDQGVLVVRSSGGAFTAVPLPETRGFEYPSALTTTSDQDTWVAGWVSNNGGPYLRQAFYLAHWDGTAFTRMKTPTMAIGARVQFVSVSAATRSNVWVAYNVRTGRDKGILLHGSATTRFRESSPPGQPFLTSVAALAGNDVWAGGRSLYRFDGATWAPAPTPPGLTYVQSLSGTSPRNLWMAYGTGSSLDTHTVAHWDGTIWTVLPDLANANGFSSTSITSISATPEGDGLWVAGLGMYATDPERNGQILYRWNGRRWFGGLGVSSFDLVQNVSAIAALPDYGLRAVGVSYGSRPGDPNYAPQQGFIATGCGPVVSDDTVQPAQLNVPRPGAELAAYGSPALTGTRTISDDLGLFTTSLLRAGGAVKLFYPAAGSYTATAQPGGQTIHTTVAMEHGYFGCCQEIRVFWATAPPPTGYRYEAQSKAPGASTFTPIAADPTATGATVPLDATGTTQFRARVVRTSDGVPSGWSPVMSLHL